MATYIPAASMPSIQILIVIFFCGFTSICAQTLAVKVEPYSSEPKAKQSINFNQPGIASTFKRFEDSAPTLIKLLQAIGEVAFACLWIMDASLNAFLWLLNETVSSFTDFFIRIFGVLFNVVKLLEAFGFGVKFLLELNYAVLSYIFGTLGCIRASFSHAVTLVKITIANETEHMYESSTMALEGVQNLLLTACNQTWVNVQYVSSIVTSNFTAPFGLSAFDTSLVASMFVAGVTFFVESVKLTAEIFKDGNMYLFNCTYNTISRIGTNVLQSFVAFLCFMRDAVTMVTSQIVYMMTWPFYFLAGLVSNISCMLYYSWEAFVNWVSYLDLSIREIVSSVFRTIGLGISGIVYSITGFINMYFPGGMLGCITMTCVAIVLFLWRKEISSLVISSWISLRRMNDNTRPIINIPDNQRPFNDDQDFEFEEDAQNEPPLDGEMPQNRTKLKYELELEKDKRLCVICQDNVKSILLLPCRHVCLCLQCLHEVRQGRVQLARCPLCRQHIQSTLEVFV